MRTSRLKGMVIAALSARVISRVMASVNAGRASVLMMHRLPDPVAGIEGHDVEYLRALILRLRQRGVRLVRVSELIERVESGEPPEPYVVAFTLDDGFHDQYQIAREVFLPLGAPLTIFPIVGFLDQELWPWDDRLAFCVRNTPRQSAMLDLEGDALELKLATPRQRLDATRMLWTRSKLLDVPQLERFMVQLSEVLSVPLPELPPPAYLPMSWDDARELEAAGVEFGSHSWSHNVFSRQSRESAEVELRKSAQRIGEELDRPLSVFAWPTGRPEDFTARDLELARAAGYRAAFAMTNDYLAFDCPDPMYRFRLDRFALPANTSDALQYSLWIERMKQRMRGRQTNVPMSHG